MKFLERFLLALSVISFLWFFSLTPGGAFMLMITLSLLSLFYFLFGLIFFSDIGLLQLFKGGLKDVTAGMMIIGVFAGIVLSILAIGILFKLLDMPGAGNMLIIGIPCTIFMLCVAGVYSQPPRKQLSKATFTRLLIFLALGIAVYMTPPMTFAKMQYREHPLYIQAYENYQQNPQDPELIHKLDLERKRIILSKEEFEMYEKYKREQRTVK
jgi:hypothetical protein